MCGGYKLDIPRNDRIWTWKRVVAGVALPIRLRGNTLFQTSIVGMGCLEHAGYVPGKLIDNTGKRIGMHTYSAGGSYTPRGTESLR